MSSLNKVQLIGRLGKDPEVRKTNTSQVANFSMATTEKYKNQKGETVETTEWHNVVAWGKLSEIIEKWVHKGDLLFIEGKLTTRKWEDKEGVTRYTTEIKADQMIMLSGKKEGNSSPSNASESSGSRRSEKTEKSPEKSKEQAPPPNLDKMPWED
jgi:single-strand DNA-binding protein